MNTPNTPIDPADVLKNPGDYLLDGRPITSVDVRICVEDYRVLGGVEGYCVFVGVEGEMDRITRRPRTRTVKARRYWTNAGKLYEWNETQTTTAGAIERLIIIDGYKWTGPEFDVTVEVP